MAGFGLVAAVGAPPVLAVGGLAIALALSRAGVSPRQWMSDLRLFWLMLAVLVLLRALTGSGPALVSVGGVGIFVQGIVDGARVCLRLSVAALAGVAVSATTRPSEIEAAVQLLLRPVPFVPEKRTATLLGLLVRFLPEVLREAHLAKEAQTARCVQQRKNPLTRLTLLAAALLKRVFVRADRLALAMEARCYSDNRTGPSLAAGSKDALAAAAMAAFLLLSLL